MIISRLLNKDENNVGIEKPHALYSDDSSPEIAPELKTETHRLALDHWHEIKGDYPLPSRADINLNRLGPILTHLVLLDVRYDPLDFIYRIIGDRVLSNFTENYTGRTLTDIPGKGPGSKVYATLENVVTTKVPCIQGVPYVGPNRDFISIESLALPLASDHETVDKIIIIVEFVGRA